jgi:WD40 repeat protein
VLTICLNEAGSHVLSGGQDRTVRLWNPRNQNSQKNFLLFLYLYYHY